ncbi:MAG: amylo-alpha-1,6-glucosidase [Pyrinomonadaceae bacterium]|nr:amylo-alpha-1,6-glucosidase [Pyrinomonadaceae bacterium]
MIKFDSVICTNFESATSREWLETNGIGGFANGTISGANSRRYHGLLTAATKPPLGRITMLSKFEETLTIDGKLYELSSNQYPNTIHPEGYKYLKSFALAPFPTWIYEVEGIEIEKTLFMVHGSNTTIIEYKIKDQKSKIKDQIEIELKPLLSFCDYHALQHETPNFNPNFEVFDNLVYLRPFAEMPALYLTHNAQSVENTGHWYRNFEYAIEKERGFDFHEDLFQPFSLKFDLTEDAIVIASTEPQQLSDALSFRMTEIARRDALIMQAEAKDEFTKQLVLAADQFIVKRGEGQTVIAGYPWFSDWGRDTMIALNGLTLATNREEIARSILLEFSNHLSEGMLPNRFPDAGEIPEYNTVDATLWYFEAIRAYAEKTKDYDFVRQFLYEKLAETIAWHIKGTRYGIFMDEDGLLHAGVKGVQLTWMDAKIGDWVVTPRIGKPVEIQALWYNALCVMADFANHFGNKAEKEQYEAMAKRAKKSFGEKFWNENEECLFDVIEGDAEDFSVRPNQIFAVSLPNTMLSIGQAKKIVQKVADELLTPVGLRSLSPKSKDYCPIYIGSPLQRDGSYHQGTVWGWLIGGFIDAYRRVNPKNKKTERQIWQFLHGFETHLSEAGLGQISEIFDADAPHLPRGCFAQAWSVAEVLRVLKK